MHILVINGHPRKNSLSGAITESYISGVQQAGIIVKKIYVCDLQFDPNVIHPTPHLQTLEPDIKEAQRLILWADHVVFIYPTWWGTMPALLKGFIDRVFISHFAFNEIEGGIGYEPLLGGRTAQLITTMDTPLLIYKLFYHAPGNNAMAIATLGFCGFIMKRTLSFGPVRYSTESKRQTWLQRAYREGFNLKKGILSPVKKFKLKTIAWLKAIRLQFYPMTFIAYMAGALGARNNNYGFDLQNFWAGYLWLFFAEVTTVLSNEYFDYSSDRQNKLFGPFNGGSRVIVDKLISFKEMKTGIFISLLLSFVSLLFLLFNLNGSLRSTGLITFTFFILAISYTVPPLKLSYRSLGELTVGITHSFAVILCGYLFQGGGAGDSFSWLLSLPLFLSVLPSIILAGIPDYSADKFAGKKTIAVRIGTTRAVQLCMGITVMSVGIVAGFVMFNILPKTFSGMLYGIIPHAALLIVLLQRYLKKQMAPGRIDKLIIVALLYLMWFAIVPLVNLI
jgi:putative NADPH-quinone reductase/1,4-dihydroxy-2-naphthoate octaprenyltransferase